MSSVATGANAERTNRWLLIGAAILAILTGILVFALLANTGGSGNGNGGTTADKKVLVAKNTIAANTKLTADMFDVKSVPSSSLVVNPVSDTSALTGQTVRTDILKGEQLSYDRLGISSKTDNQLAFIVTPGLRAKSIPVTAPDIVSGLIVPDDHVDIVLTYHQSAGGTGNGNDITRVETVLQNIRVLALAQTTVDAQPVVDSSGTPIATGQGGQIGQRPDDVKAAPNAGMITLELTPDQVQVLTAAVDKGKLSLSLRNPADTTPVAIPPFYQGDAGRINNP